MKKTYRAWINQLEAYSHKLKLVVTKQAKRNDGSND